MAVVFLVLERTLDHAPDPVYSVWDSRAGAEVEVARLDVECCSTLGYDLLEVAVNTRSTQPIT